MAARFFVVGSLLTGRRCGGPTPQHGYAVDLDNLG